MSFNLELTLYNYIFKKSDNYKLYGCLPPPQIWQQTIKTFKNCKPPKYAYLMLIKSTYIVSLNVSQEENMHHRSLNGFLRAK